MALLMLNICLFDFVLYLSYFFINEYKLISCQIAPLQHYIPTPLPYKKVLYRASILRFALDLCSKWSAGAEYSCVRHLHPFLLISLKNKWGGYNDAMGLISRDIAKYIKMHLEPHL